MAIEQNNLETWNGKKSVEYYKKEHISPIEKSVLDNYFKGKTLDLGSGCGRLTKYLADRGLDVIGVEIVNEMVDISKKRYPKIPFFVGDATHLKFKDASFDSIYFNAIDFIYPKEKRVLALREISRVLKKDGTLVLNLHVFSLLKPRFILRNLLKKTLFSQYKYEKGDIGELYVFYASKKRHIKIVEAITGLRFNKIIMRRSRDSCPYFVFTKN